MSVPAIRLHGFELRENHLVAEGEPSFDEWVACGDALKRIEASVMFWLGDWWRVGEHRYGESASQAADIGYAVQTMMNAAWVCGKIEPSRRRESLTFGHHEAVASLEPAQQDEILTRAETEQMSVRDVRHAVQSENGLLTHFVLVQCKDAHDAAICMEAQIITGRAAKIVTRKHAISETAER